MLGASSRRRSATRRIAAVTETLRSGWLTSGPERRA
jgi:dTDP-4-amino-4,6-dideoxygalactose transaminase